MSELYSSVSQCVHEFLIAEVNGYCMWLFIKPYKSFNWSLHLSIRCRKLSLSFKVHYGVPKPFYGHMLKYINTTANIICEYGLMSSYIVFSVASLRPLCVFLSFSLSFLHSGTTNKQLQCPLRLDLSSSLDGNTVWVMQFAQGYCT